MAVAGPGVSGDGRASGVSGDGRAPLVAGSYAFVFDDFVFFDGAMIAPSTY